MANLFKLFKTDEKVEKDGIILQYGDAEFRVARAGASNTKFQKLLERKLKPYRRQLQMEMAEEKVIRGLMMEVYAETIVLDFKNVVDEDGKTPIPYSKENCLKLFQRLPDLFDDIREQSMKAALFRADIREDEAKN